MVVSKFEGKRLISPNDLVFDSKGNLWFTDPHYGQSIKEEFGGGEFTKVPKCEICVNETSVYRLTK